MALELNWSAISFTPFFNTLLLYGSITLNSKSPPDEMEFMNLSALFTFVKRVDHYLLLLKQKVKNQSGFNEDPPIDLNISPCLLKRMTTTETKNKQTKRILTAQIEKWWRLVVVVELETARRPNPFAVRPRKRAAPVGVTEMRCSAGFFLCSLKISILFEDWSEV